MERIDYPCYSDPDLFHSDAPPDMERAKRMCDDCPLSRFRACQHEGWDNEHGVWGGMSPVDRKAANPLRFASIVRASKRDATRIDATLTRDRVLAMRREGVPVRVVAEKVGKTPNAVKLIDFKARQAALAGRCA